MPRNAKIGLTLIAGITVLYLFIAWAKSIHMFAANRTSYVVECKDVTGLKAGDPVMVFGIEVGNVKSIKLAEGKANVIIAVDRDVVLHPDAQAVIKMKELMGGKLVDINPGMNSGRLEKGAIIPGNNAMDFSSAFATMGTFMDGWDKERIDSLVINLNEVAGAFAELGKSLKEDEVASLMTSLSASAESLERMMKEAEQKQLIARLDAMLQNTDKLITQAESAMENVDKFANIIDSRMPGIDSLVRSGTTTLTNIESVLGDTKEMFEAMRNKESTVGKLLYDKQFAEEVDEAIDNLNKTMVHVREKRIRVTMSLKKDKKGANE